MYIVCAHSAHGLRLVHMRTEERKEARKLRAEGKSIKEIERLIGVRRSSVSVWVRDIELTREQKHRLIARNTSLDVLERRRKTRFANEYARRMPFVQQGIADVASRRNVDIFMLGIGLFWGEGSKTSRGVIELSNTDPRVIQMHVLFLRQVCKVDPKKIHGHVGIHSHLSTEQAEKYWSKISGIPLVQFYRTSIQKSKAGKGRRDPLPHGTFSVGVNSTEMRLRLEGWMQGVYQRLFPKNTDLHSMTKLRI